MKKDLGFFIFNIFWWDWGLSQYFLLTKQTLYRLSHTSIPLCSDYFGDGLS
jgi:hypothetical protein